VPSPAKVQIYSKRNPRDNWGETPIQACYNPAELTIEKALDYATAPGNRLDAPTHQNPRPRVEKMTLALFFDTSDKGMGDTAVSVAGETDKLYQLVKIDGDSHAPPICLVVWGDGFPGSQEGGQGEKKTRVDNSLPSRTTPPRYGFVCLVESIRQHFTLFSSGGVPLRADVTLTLAQYTPLDEQVGAGNQKSPDRSHGHVLRRGEALWHLSAQHYRKPGEWRAIAAHNGVEDPRRLSPGRQLTVPPLR
jgi:hypothetical protein